MNHSLSFCFFVSFSFLFLSLFLSFFFLFFSFLFSFLFFSFLFFSSFLFSFFSLSLSFFFAIHTPGCCSHQSTPPDPCLEAIHMLLCVVIMKQVLKFHTLNTGLKQVKISTLITGQLVKWVPFSLVNCIYRHPFHYHKKVPFSLMYQKRSFTNHLHGLT